MFELYMHKCKNYQKLLLFRRARFVTELFFYNIIFIYLFNDLTGVAASK